LTSSGLSALVDAFSGLYRERYAFFFEGEPIELVNLRLAAFGLNDPIELPCAQPGLVESGKSMRPVYFEKLGVIDTAVFQRDSLRPGMKLSGPTIVEEPTSATLIPPGTSADVASDLGLFVRL